MVWKQMIFLLTYCHKAKSSLTLCHNACCFLWRMGTMFGRRLKKGSNWNFIVLEKHPDKTRWLASGRLAGRTVGQPCLSKQNKEGFPKMIIWIILYHRVFIGMLCKHLFYDTVGLRNSEIIQIIFAEVFDRRRSALSVFWRLDSIRGFPDVDWIVQEKWHSNGPCDIFLFNEQSHLTCQFTLILLTFVNICNWLLICFILIYLETKIAFLGNCQSY